MPGGGLVDRPIHEKFLLGFKYTCLFAPITFQVCPCLHPCRPRMPKKEVVAGTKEEVDEMKVGDRCEVFPGGRRGKVGFVGETKFQKGYGS